MFYVRTASTASGATAVQVIRYRFRKRIVVKHIGSAHSEEEIVSLKQIANRWIETTTQQQELFPTQAARISPLVSVDKLQNLGFRHMFAYETLGMLLQQIIGLSGKQHQLLLDLVLIRIIQPASKLASFSLLFELFGIAHERATFYRNIPAIIGLKPTIEEQVIACAKKHFSFDFRIVFYDVTTLYFENFVEDTDTVDEKGAVVEKGLRKNGFSKENKSNQPQIVIGLIVTKEGFPVSYDVFEGNTFEGKTFLPIITRFKQSHKVEELTVVGDAAMVSFDNIQELLKEKLSYIVGARMANLKQEEIAQAHRELIGQRETLEELQKVDKASMRIETERGLLVCDFSYKRYLKDKRDMEKQIKKAKKLLEKNEGVKRAKFLKSKEKKEGKTGDQYTSYRKNKTSAWH